MAEARLEADGGDSNHGDDGDGRQRDSTSGQYTGVSDADVVAAVRAHDPAATSEIGDELGISRQAADQRLRKLAEEGRVSKKKIGASLVWFLPRQRTAPATPAEHEPRERREPAHEPAPVDDDQLDSDDVDGDETASEDAHAVVEEIAASWDDDHRLEDRKAAARAVLEHALESGEAVGKSDAVERFHDDHAVDGQSEETWWRQNCRPVLRAVGDYSNGERGYVVDHDAVDAVARGDADS